jgi:hypothetical protein
LNHELVNAIQELYEYRAPLIILIVPVKMPRPSGELMSER